MIFSIKDAVPKELLENIKRSVTDELLANIPNKLGAYNRVGKTLNISKEPELNQLDTQICEFITKLSDEYISYRFRPAFTSGDSGYEFHRYEPGDACLLHADGEFSFDKSNTSLLRYATVILQLNTIETGGELVFPHQNKTFPTIEGQVIIFPPYGGYQHYVTPSSERRDILMTWMVYNNIIVSKTE
jgi:hypothetical protein